MNNKKILISVFILVALVQMYVPAKMILDKENVLEKGTEYKFKTVPIDPNDPFRGKYIRLGYTENKVAIPNEKDWIRGETVYVSLSMDYSGFARIKSISKGEPTDDQNFIKAKVAFVTGNDSNELIINYPFDRYYLEESKADQAESAYGQSRRDTVQITYALVSVKDGDAVLKDVLIDGISIKEIVKGNQKNEK